jgi:hypothetical protein
LYRYGGPEYCRINDNLGEAYDPQVTAAATIGIAFGVCIITSIITLLVCCLLVPRLHTRLAKSSAGEPVNAAAPKRYIMRALAYANSRMQPEQALSPSLPDDPVSSANHDNENVVIGGSSSVDIAVVMPAVDVSASVAVSPTAMSAKPMTVAEVSPTVRSKAPDHNKRRARDDSDSSSDSSSSSSSTSSTSSADKKKTKTKKEYVRVIVTVQRIADVCLDRRHRVRLYQNQRMLCK